MAIGGFGRILDWNDYTVVDTRPVSRTPNAPKLDCESDIRIPYSGRAFATPAGVIGFKEVSVTILIRKETSWVLADKQTPALLNHEQTHYMIDSIAARQMLRTLSKVTGKTHKEASKNFDTAADVLDARRKAVQLRYDEDPKVGAAHGANATQQLVWDHAATIALAKDTGTLEDLP
jgi:hypothetical protein